ncbi:MAG: endolytic transglycosylase MltG [Clostridiales Family XIII bacterium]|jgi:UPF0755 protein|nr:endolytic transglycosylase MltG [Clostridiales Family XIII bacterium]
MSRSERGVKRKKSVLRVVVIAIIVVILLAVAAAVGLYFYADNAAKPVDAADATPVSLEVPEGSGSGAIAKLLEENGLIGDARVFRLRSRLQGRDGEFKAGVYELSRAMSMDAIMDKLSAGVQAVKRFTIPEGYTVEQTRDKLAGDGIADAADFTEALQGDFPQYAFLDGLPDTENRLEGFLYPETYDIFVSATAQDVIERMLRQFDSLFTEEYYGKAEEMGLSVLEVVTVASLIERETKVAEERALVASVVYNRLAQGMKLEIDATVQYALGEQKERLLYADLEIDSPYNTYKIPGLPPAPICSPRMACIEAALYPADTDYIYYVLKPEMNGAHNFASDYSTFLRYKDAYLKAL